MYCPNCGMPCDSKFCTNCGTRVAESVCTPVYPPLTEPYIQVINGREVDLHKILRAYGHGFKMGAYACLCSDYGVTRKEAKAILDPLYEAHKDEKVTFWQGLKAEVDVRGDRDDREKQRRQQLDAQGSLYCPKCLSTAVDVRSKGFSFGRAVLGGMISPAIGMAASASTLGKLKCTCLKCGHKWKPDK